MGISSKDVELNQKAEIGVFDNTAEDEIRVNESKARLLFRDFIAKNKVQSPFVWLGLVVACWAVVIGGYNDIPGIVGSGGFIYHAFIIGALVSTIGFIASCCGYWKAVRKYNEDSFIKRLKKEE